MRSGTSSASGSRCPLPIAPLSGQIRRSWLWLPMRMPLVAVVTVALQTLAVVVVLLTLAVATVLAVVVLALVTLLQKVALLQLTFLPGGSGSFDPEPGRWPSGRRFVPHWTSEPRAARHRSAVAITAVPDAAAVARRRRRHSPMPTPSLANAAAVSRRSPTPPTPSVTDAASASRRSLTPPSLADAAAVVTRRRRRRGHSPPGHPS